MTVKKKKVFGVNLSNLSVELLKKNGYLNGRLKVVRNFSKYVSELIIDDLRITSHCSVIDAKISVKVRELNELMSKRDKLQDLIVEFAADIKKLKEGRI